MSRNFLVVTADSVDRSSLRERVLEQIGEADANVKIVAPASKVSRLDWLTNAEDDARMEAGRAADDAAAAVGDAADVEAEVGDTDPVLAIEDALREFRADEIVLVSGSETGKGWLEDERSAAALDRIGVPVRRIELGGSLDSVPADATGPVREAAEGRTPRTPFMVLGSVAATVWAAAAVVALVALLLFWLL